MLRYQHLGQQSKLFTAIYLLSIGWLFYKRPVAVCEKVALHDSLAKVKPKLSIH